MEGSSINESSMKLPAGAWGVEESMPHGFRGAMETPSKEERGGAVVNAICFQDGQLLAYSSTPKQAEEIIEELYLSGLSVRKVASALSLPFSRVYRVLRSKGLMRAWDKAVITANTKKWKRNEEPGERDKEVLWILARTDGHVRRMRRQVHLSIRTPDWWLMNHYREVLSYWAEPTIRARIFPKSFTKEKWEINVLLPLPYHEYLLSRAPPPISWRGVAELVNTEGSICISKHRERTRVAIIMSNTDRRLLERVQRFLDKNGVHSSIRRRKTRKKRGKRRELYDLWIERNEAVVKVLREVQGSLIYWKRLFAAAALQLIGQPWKYASPIIGTIKAIRAETFKRSKEEIRLLAESPLRPLKLKKGLAKKTCS